MASTVVIAERCDGIRETFRHPTVDSHPVRVCIVYDCLFPWTVGGAERWYRNLAERLAAEGNQVTYLTRKQWSRDDPPGIPGVRVVAVSGPDELYGTDGNRLIGPTLRFGAGVFRHLARHGRNYEVVHTASFPYFSVLAAAAARPLGRYRLFVDWHEVWSREYWQSYLGNGRGAVGFAVQRACVKVRHQPFCFSRLHRDRLLEEGVSAEPILLEGEYLGNETAPEVTPSDGSVVFAGRLIPEKNAIAAVRAMALLRDRGLLASGAIFGNGPELAAVRKEIDRLGLGEAVSAPGFVEQPVLEEAINRAACLLHPSAREGYGLVVVEASARGVPVVVAAGPDNAAVELVEAGVNGEIALSPRPEYLADAVERVLAGDEELRRSTCDWFEKNVDRLSLDSSLAAVTAEYGSR